MCIDRISELDAQIKSLEDRVVCTHDCPECKGQMETEVIWYGFTCDITGRCSECKIEVKV
tara:strand:- start:49388 stop:49567 length:180 start_codon:yes stop_codon:yes gene_type:complete